MKTLIFVSYIFTFLFICFCISFTKANPIIDSLENVLEKRVKLDTQRVDMLNHLGFEYWIVDPNESEKYGRQAQELATMLEYEEGIAYSNRIIGVAHWARGNYDPAIEHLFKAIQQYHDLKNTLGMSNCTMNLGMVHAAQKDYEQALKHYRRAIKGFEKTGEEGRIATTHTKMGTVHAEQGNYDEAYEYFLKALEVHEKQNFTYGLGEVNNRLGSMFIQKGDLDKSLSYLFRAVEASEKRNDQHGLASNYALIGHNYLLQKDYTQAETYLKRAEKIAAELGIKTTLKEVYWDFKNMKVQQGDFRNALGWMQAYSDTKDSLMNDEIALEMAKLHSENAVAWKDFGYKLEMKDKELLEQQNRLNRLLLIIAFLSLILLGLLAYWLFQKQKAKSRAVLLQEQALRKKQATQLATEREKTKELQAELAQKSKELTSYTLNFIRKNEMIDDIRSTLKEIKEAANPTTKRQVRTLEQKLRTSFQIDEDWETFRRHFEDVHPQFFTLMKTQHPELSNNDLKLCVLARLNLNTKEMAAILGISPDSVKTARYRLRRKMQLQRSKDILDYLVEMESKAGWN